MDYLEKNLEYLKIKNKTIYKALEELTIDFNYKSCGEKQKFNLIKTRDNKQTIEICYDISKKIRLNSVYNSEKEAKRWAAKYKEQNKITSLIMFGYGNGIIYKEMNKKLDTNAKIFFYEPDKYLFLFCLTNFDMTEIFADRRVKLYVDEINSDDLYSDVCGTVNWAMLPTQVICSHPGYNEIYRNEYKKFKTIIEQFKYVLELEKNTSIKFSKQFTKNSIKNLKFIKGSNYIAEFKNKIDSDIPLIIVSAGPSLDDNILELKKAKHKSFILATDTAVKYLLKNDVWFDAIVTIDGSKPTSYLDGDDCKNKSLFIVPYSNSEILEKNCGRKIWINGSGILEILYKKCDYEFPKYESGGSVATAAFWIAKYLKIKTIILVGQDLAYKGKNTHAGNIADTIDEENTLYVDGIYHEKVKTRGDWVRYKQWFENVIKLLDYDVEVIDATEGGAIIKGTKIMKLSDAIYGRCVKNFDFETILADVNPTFLSGKYKIICNYIANLLNEFDIIASESERGLQFAKENMNMLSDSNIIIDKINFNLQQIINLQEKIQRKDIYLLLDEYISADIDERINLASQSYSDEKVKLYENMKSNRMLFESLIKAVDDLKPYLKKVIKNL